MGLHLPPNVQIEQVIICYEVTNSRSFIAQTRLAEMTTPDHANVVHDDPTHLTNTAPTSYNSVISGPSPTGAVTLELRLDFQHTNDQILLGAVGVNIRADSECCVNSIADLRILGPGSSDCLTVLLGYDVPGDGGGGEFFWDSSFNVDLNIWPPGEDGGLVIRPNSLQPTQPGRWRRTFEAALSVKWFGAKGDGKTIHDGAMNAGATQLTSQAGAFTPDDVGKGISVDGAGAVQDLCTTITHISATEVTLASAASTSVIGASVGCISWPPNAPTLSDGMMTAGSHVLTITIQSGALTPSDIGRVLRVAGAGSPGPLHSGIGSFISPTQVNLQSPAVTKVSMATVFWGTDDTDDIQAAEDAASLIKSIVLFPPGTFIINGAKNAIPDGRKYGIEKKSNTKWFGCGYASSILKLKSNSTSDPADPQKTVDPQMIYSNAEVNDIGFYRLGFDLNGANNTLCAPANVAAIWFNGDNLEVNGMVVEGCKFYHGPGATVILVQNRATSWSGYPLDDVLIKNNRFEDNCLSPVTGDHSTVNVWARRTRVTDNIFQQTSDGLLGYWRFNGNGEDLSGNGQDLSLFNAGFGPGLFGQALALLGNSSSYGQQHFLNAALDTSDFTFGSSDFTVQVWFNLNINGREQTLIEKFTGSGGPGWTLTTPGGNNLQFYSTPSVVLNAGATFTTGVWHEAVVRRSGNRFDLFFDGNNVDSRTAPGALTISPNPLLIGKRNPQDGRDFSVNGSLDEIAIWNRALSDCEIAQIWNGGSGMPLVPGAVPTIQRYTGAVMEFHGADGLFLGNIIRGYGRVVIASENFIEPWEHLLIANNMASDLGMRFVSIEVGNGSDTKPGKGSDTKPIDKIIVRGNQVAFNADTSEEGVKAGLMQVHGKPISYIEVSDNYFEMLSPSAGIWSIGVSSQAATPGTSYTEHLKVSGNTFNKMMFGVWVDNVNHHDQVKNLEYVNNTCLNMQDLSTTPEAAGLWADGSASQHIENLVVTGNRFINEANNAGYKYGVSLGQLYIDSLYLDDNVFYNIKTPIWYHP